MNVETMQELGVFDTYNHLTNFCHDFLERNYSLSQQDMQAIFDDQTTKNLDLRQLTYESMKDKINEILEREAEYNRNLMDNFYNNPEKLGIIQESLDYKDRLYTYEQELLESRWNAINEYESTQENTSNQEQTFMDEIAESNRELEESHIAEQNELEQSNCSQDLFHNQLDNVSPQQVDLDHNELNEMSDQQLIDGVVDLSIEQGVGRLSDLNPMTQQVNELAQQQAMQIDMSQISVDSMMGPMTGPMM